MKSKAIQLVGIGQPLELREVSLSAPQPGEAVVRVKAAGICHSDAHYRAGISRVAALPLTLGHEVAGIVEEPAGRAGKFGVGDRVCVHYLVTCGECTHCRRGNEQFCPRAAMIGKHRHGGYAEFLVVPERNLFRLPEEISFEHGAVMMCSSATSLHALNVARFQAGETVAVFGAGGLGLSAIQLALAKGAREVFAVDVSAEKLELARELGAVPINARESELVKQLLERTNSLGVNVSLELIGLPETMRQSVQCLSVQGRAAIAGLSQRTFEVAPYNELINKEAEVMGVSDHLASELPELLNYARAGKLELSSIITRRLPLEAGAVNQVLDDLESFKQKGRAVIVSN